MFFDRPSPINPRPPRERYMRRPQESDRHANIARDMRKVMLGKRELKKTGDARDARY
jgi:hypothetical protein